MISENSTRKKLPAWMKLLYGSGDWGISSGGMMRSIFYAIYMTDVVGLSPRLASLRRRKTNQIDPEHHDHERKYAPMPTRIGKLIGCLHKHGIIHGDLTTSNMILTPYGKVVFVDFGLGEFSDELEIRGVDLHLMKRALQSTHHKYAKECFEAVTKGYAETAGKKAADKELQKIEEVERRGRYVEEW